MTANANEKKAARALAAELGISYVHALRILRERRAAEQAQKTPEKPS